MNSIFYVYILRCAGDRFYCGYSPDIKKRMLYHKKTGTRFTKAFKPIEVAAYWEIFGSKSDAMKVEALLKKQSREKKDLLVSNEMRLKTVLSESLLEIEVKKGKKIRSLNKIFL